MPAKTILVAVDGSEIADNAFNYAIEYLYKENDTIIVLRVPEYDVSLSALGGNWEKVCEEAKKKEKEIDDCNALYVQKLREHQISGRAVKMPGGKAGEVICETARKEGVTHLVMGTRGLGVFQKAFLGSVSQFVLNHADMPVTIVPAPAQCKK